MADEYEIYRSDYTAEQIENQITNSVPQIDDDTLNWLTWDIDTGAWINTGSSSKGAKGDTGDTGEGASVTETTYASSSSGTVTPTSGWSTTIPTVPSGYYLWQRIEWNNGTYTYLTARQGQDGSGAVTSVNGQSGTVVLTASDIGTYGVAPLNSSGKIDSSYLPTWDGSVS